jgi:hypothetical protein
MYIHLRTRCTCPEGNIVINDIQGMRINYYNSISLLTYVDNLYVYVVLILLSLSSFFMMAKGEGTINLMCCFGLVSCRNPYR